MAAIFEPTEIFDEDMREQMRCPDCDGRGELRIDSENINEHFEVEKQTVITSCPRCNGTGFVAAA